MCSQDPGDPDRHFRALAEPTAAVPFSVGQGHRSRAAPEASWGMVPRGRDTALGEEKGGQGWSAHCQLTSSAVVTPSQRPPALLWEWVLTLGESWGLGGGHPRGLAVGQDTMGGCLHPPPTSLI